MKWIWFLLFLAILGEIMDTMEFADAAKKKRKKKITKKKKKAKAKAKKKPNGRSTTKRPNTGYQDPGLIFYSPSPPANWNPNSANYNIDLNNDTHNGTLHADATNFVAVPVAVPIEAAISTAIIGQNGFKKMTWFQRTRQRRFIHENPFVLEYLGLVDSGKTKNFDVEHLPKRSIRLARSIGHADHETTLVDGHSNQVGLIESRRKRAVDSKDGLKRLEAKKHENQNRLKNKQNQEEIKDQLDRPKRSPGKMREFGFEEKLQLTQNNAKNRWKRGTDNVSNKNLGNIKNQWNETEDGVRGKMDIYDYRRSKRAAERRDKIEPKDKIRNKQREDINNTQGNRDDEVRERLGRPKRSLNNPKGQQGEQQQQQEMQSKRNKPKPDDLRSINVVERQRDKLPTNKDEIMEHINRPKRDVKSQVDKVKEKLETRRQKQQEKRKQNMERQEAKRTARRESLNAKRNVSAGGRLETMPIDREAVQLEVMPGDIQHNSRRPKRSIDAEVFRLQSLDTSEECIDEDCFSDDESCDGTDCSSGSDEGPAGIENAERFKRDGTHNSGQREPSQVKVSLPNEGFDILPSRTKRQTLDVSVPKAPASDLSKECTGEDCSSEECVGEDCTYEDSDSEESEELIKIVAERHVEDDGPVALLVRDRREIGRSKNTGKQMDFVGGCGGNGDVDYYGDYDGGTGNLGDYGSDDYSEERRRKRNRKKNSRNNRKGRRYRNNRRNKGRKNRRNRQNRRLKSSTSLDQTTKSPFGVTASTGRASYLPLDAAVTFSPDVGMNSEPFMSLAHPLSKRTVDRRETTPLPSRTTKPPDLGRQKRNAMQEMHFEVVSTEPIERVLKAIEIGQYLQIPLPKVKRQVPADERKFKLEGKPDRGLPKPKSNKPDRQKRGIEPNPVMYSPMIISPQKLSDEELAELWKNVNDTMQEKSAIPVDGLLLNMPLNSTRLVERSKRSPTPNVQESLGGFQNRMAMSTPDDLELLETSSITSNGSFTWASYR